MKRQQFTPLFLVAALVGLGLTGWLATAQGSALTRVSVDSNGAEGNSWSSAPAISADGRHVAFRSSADNLVSGDTNGQDDVFVHDRQTGKTVRVSVSTAGAQGDAPSGGGWRPSLSANGRYVAFASSALLVAGGPADVQEIFVRDRDTDNDGVFDEPGAVSTARVSQSAGAVAGNADSDYPALSGDGRYVAFWSEATNLVAGDTNEGLDIFVYDRQGGTLSRVAVGGAGWVAFGGPLALSHDGRYIALEAQGHVALVAEDTNGLTDVYVYDRTAVTFSRVSVLTGGGQAEGNSLSPSMSSDGRYVAFESDATSLTPGHTDEFTDIFVHDRNSATTTRVSIGLGGTALNNLCSRASISAEGRYVAFTCSASNLTAGDANGAADIFVWDRNTGQISLVSAADSGVQANGDSYLADVSGDGRMIAFDSYASNLAPDDVNSVTDVFVSQTSSAPPPTYSVSGRVRDGSSQPIAGVVVYAGSSGSATTDANGDYVITGLVTGTYTLLPDKIGYSFTPLNRAVSVPPSGTGQNFTGTLTSIPTPVPCTMTTTRVSVNSSGGQASGGSNIPAMSADGRYVAFRSWADDLVSSDTNSTDDIFMRDRTAAKTTRVSVASDGSEANGSSGGEWHPVFSTDGRRIAFASDATDLVDGDTNAAWDIFVHDRVSGQTVRVSVASNGTQGNGNSDYPAISGNGRYVAFWSESNTLAPGDTNDELDIFVHDLDTHETNRIAVGGAGGVAFGGPLALSHDGRIIAFEAQGHVALVAADTNSMTDIYVHDRTTGVFSRVSVLTGGGQVEGVSLWPSMSSDGRYVAFKSSATDLTPGHTDGFTDIFVHDRTSATTTRVSTGLGGAAINGNCDRLAISANGRWVAFECEASNLVTGDTNTAADVFVWDRILSKTSRVSVANTGAQANGDSRWPALSSDGRYVAFESSAGNLVSNDSNAVDDIFVHTQCVPELRQLYLPLVMKQ